MIGLAKLSYLQDPMSDRNFFLSATLDGMQFWTPIFFTDIKQFLLAHGYVALTNDMLKVYKVAQV